jgi:flagellar hook assembly protein FlgD
MTTTPTVPSTPSTVSQTQQTINTSLGSLANNYQTFLSLLTTQLKNQDPLSPLDTNQFTQQLTQMTGVEQQLLGNQLLQQLVTEQGGLSQAAALIGKTVTAPDPTGKTSGITGAVTAVTQTNGETILTVGQTQVPLSSVSSIAAGSNPLSALLGG